MNKINRHNYETFFILYMDNELSSEERLMVEDFVKQYPELKEELDVLMQYKLQPDDDIVFANKEGLMMQLPAAAAEPDMETRIMLYLDGELNAFEKQELESLIAANTQLQETLHCFQKSKLQSAHFAFPYKDSLYRNEKATKRNFILWRYRVAAILLLVIGLAVFFNLNNNNNKTDDPIVKIETKATQPQTINNKTELTNAVLEKEQTENQVAATSIKPEQKTVLNNTKEILPAVSKQQSGNMITANGKQEIKEKIIPQLPQLQQKAEQAIAVENKPSNNLPSPENNPNLKPSLQKQDANASLMANVQPNPETNNLLKQNDAHVIQASLTTTQNMVTEDDLENGGKNKKNRGLFRKIVRTIVKRTHATTKDDEDDSKILIGGFAIRMK